MQARHLQLLRGIDYDVALRFVKDQVIANYKPMYGTMVKTISSGNTEVTKTDVLKYLESVADKVITPAGSIYRPATEKMSVVADMIVEKMSMRKALKKKQFKAANAGDSKMKNLYKHQQTSMKRVCNSLPGGFASPFNIMYDKGGYNSITSCARSMIGLAITTAEQLLGGNFSWFSEEDMINFIIVVLKACGPEDKITAVVTKYRLEQPSADKVFEYYKELGKIYSPSEEFLHVKQIIYKLKQHELSFLYYYCNLRNIIWNNETVFRPYIHHLFGYKNLAMPDATVDDLYKHDESIIALTTVVFAPEFKGMSMDAICADKASLNKLVALCNMMSRKLKQLDDLFSAFINIPIIAPNIPQKPKTLRNTVIISDTDSVIFTATAWDVWYRGDSDAITHDAYQITALVIYWLHNVVRYIMRVFSIINCVSEKNLSVLAMKNEFLYPIMLLYDIRKTYVGIVAAQEGNILEKPTPDIKGQTLKGSMFCEHTRKFTEEFITDDVLFKSMNGKLSAAELIAKIVDFETSISNSIESGSCEFFKITSLKNESDYKTPDATSIIKSWTFWEAVFSKQYGAIIPPAKVQVFPSLKVTERYLVWLKQYPKIYDNLLTYLEDNKQVPNILLINPLVNIVPPELIPLIDKRAIIYHNVQPIYSVLERIGIVVGGNKEKLLFSDIYGSVRLCE